MAQLFSTFMTQFQQTGRERADGWSPTHFENLSADELARAREMLLARISQGDMADMDGIVHIADAGVVGRLVQIYKTPSLTGQPRVALARTLRLLTGADAWLDDIFRASDADDPALAGFAGSLLGQLEVPARMMPAVVSRLLDGRHETQLLPLTEVLLRLSGRRMATMQDFVTNLPLLRQVCDAPLEVRGGIVRGLLPP